jgi:glucokinase
VIVLAADIGGTHARLGLVEIDHGAPQVIAKESYDSRRVSEPEPLVRQFIAAHPAPPFTRAAFAVAGPVEHGVSRLPNLKWQLDAAILTKALRVPTMLINDFVAIGHAVPLLGPDDVVALQGASIPERAPIAVIGAGTGLGHVLLLWDGTGYLPHASEAGHADFAPADALQSELLAYLRAEYGHVSWERVVSGPGIGEIYRFLARKGVAPEQPVVAAEIAAGDPAPVITTHALAASDALSVAALDLFVAAYGAQAANFALSVGAQAVFVTGGIAPRILPKLKDGSFAQAFGAKGRFGEGLATMPVRVVIRDDAGLIGAARAAQCS